MTGFEWIGGFARWAVAWVPRLIHVQANQGAVKFVAARTVELKPGIHFYWPVTTSVSKTQVARCILELDTQPIVTADGITVAAGGIVSYRVTDVHRYLVDNYDADTNLGEAAEVALRRAVVAKKFDELQKNRAEIDHKLTDEVQKLMTDFGVEVLFARLAALAPANVLFVVGAGAIASPAPRTAPEPTE